MSRGRRLKSLDDYARSLKNKYGLGEGENYKPWLRVQDVPSTGLASKIQGIKANREHHTLSKLETEFLFLAEFSDVVVDIREQFPLLPMDLTVKISKTINVNHPVVPGTDTMHLMTTDFLLTCSDTEKKWYVAVSVKSEKDLRDKRVLEKLEIERLWWELLGVEFVLFCGTSNTSIQSKNIAWVTDPIRHRLDNLNLITEELKEQALDLIVLGKQLHEVICQEFLDKLELEGIDPLILMKVLIAEKRLVTDLTLPMVETGIISIIGIKTLV